jgi:hypothetical protein
MLKRSRFIFVSTFTALILTVSTLVLVDLVNAAPQHGFSVRQYETFHDVLHPLEHEALPNKDFKRIRANSSLLVRRGNAIVMLGIPRGTSKDQRAEFRTELRKFSRALVKFRNDARRGTDDQMKTSYSAVHDTFEMLASMLPKK